MLTSLADPTLEDLAINIVQSVIFAGMSGSAVADAVGLGKIIIEMMRKENRYSAGYAAAITAAASTIGPIIPPSIPMVMFALISDTSIGYLFLGETIVLQQMAGIVLVLAGIVLAVGVRRRDPVPAVEVPAVGAGPAVAGAAGVAGVVAVLAMRSSPGQRHPARVEYRSG